MSMTVRTSISRKNRYHISRHRYLELYHFCLQYNEWRATSINSYNIGKSILCASGKRTNQVSRPTEDLAVKISQGELFMKLVKETCFESDGVIGKWLFIGVTEGASFNKLKLLYNLPCERDMYYDRYRKFFWLLDKKR